MPIQDSGTRVFLTPDWSPSAYDDVASALAEAFGLPVEAIDENDPTSGGYRGFRLCETDTTVIEVGRMLVNWRVMEMPKGFSRPVPNRYWCYPGTGVVDLLLAVSAVAEWDRGQDTEPRWWVKNGQTGETRKDWK